MSQQWSRIAAMMKSSPVGLDVSDRTIEIVSLSEEGGEPKIKSMSRALLPRGVVERGRIKNEQKLAAALDAAMKNARPEPIEPDHVIFGIPEGQIYTHVFELGEHKREDRDRLVQEEMEASLPLRQEESHVAYETLYESPRTGIILIATQKAVFAEWQRFFKNTGIQVDMYESETVAAARGLFQAPPQSPVCVVDIGAGATTISIFSKRGLRYLQTLPDAGDAITLSLSKELGIPPKDAEQMKIKMGLSDKHDKGFFIIAKMLQAIMARVKAGIDYFQEKTGERVERVVLIGGSAHLKGIKEYFGENLNTPAWLGESVLLRNQGFLEYIEAAGLALRGLYPKKYLGDPAFPGTVDAGAPAEAQTPVLPTTGHEQDTDTVVIVPVQFVRMRATRGQKLALLGVLVAGIGGVFGADSVRNMLEARSSAETPAAILLRDEGIQIFNEAIPIVVGANTRASGGARGEIFEAEVSQATGYPDAVASARTGAIQAARQRGMDMWQEPINRPADVAKLAFPLRVQWLFYGADGVERALFSKISQKVETDISMLSPRVTVLGVAPTADKAIFTLSARVRVLTPEHISPVGGTPGGNTSADTPGQTISRVVILNTDTGWLNARNGPGTGYGVVTRVHPGEKYALRGEEGKWYKIDMGGEGGTVAWVHSQYARKE